MMLLRIAFFKLSFLICRNMMLNLIEMKLTENKALIFTVYLPSIPFAN
jgi:hypothetical protein